MKDITTMSSFRDWTIEKCLQFAADLADNEDDMAENAAMAMTCQLYGIESHEGYEVLFATEGAGK